MKKILFGMIATVLVIVLFAGCTSEKKSKDKWATIEKRGTIIVGLDDTFVPMGFKDTNGEITGFDVDLAKEAFKRMDLKVEFQAIDWTLKETELNAGNIDLIWNGYSINEERKGKVNFTSPYLDNRQVVVVLSTSDISKKADLKEKNVATQNGSSALEAIEADGANETFKNGEAILFDSYNDAFMDLEASRVDAIVADEILARYYIAQRGQEKYSILEEDFGDEEYGVGVRKQDVTLLEKLNATIDEMKADGSAASISRKWFGENIVK